MAPSFELPRSINGFDIGKRKEDDGKWNIFMSKAILVVPSAIAGMIVGFCLDRMLDLRQGGQDDDEEAESPSKSGRATKVGRGRRPISRGAAMQKVRGTATGSSSSQACVPANMPADNSELKMILVVRLDLKMGSGKIAAQCAHAALGMYSELSTRNRALLRRYEDCGQPKIVVTCKNQQEMNELRGRAQGAGLPTFTVADAGRTQVAAGSKTVLAIGPGPKNLVDTVTRHLKLL